MIRTRSGSGRVRCGAPGLLRAGTIFPKGKHDDQVDSTAQFLDWFKIPMPHWGIFEYTRQLAEEARQRRKPEPTRTEWAKGSMEWLAAQTKEADNGAQLRLQASARPLQCPVSEDRCINMVIVIASEAKQSRAVELNPGEIASPPFGLGSVCSAASLRCFPSTPSGGRMMTFLRRCC